MIEASTPVRDRLAQAFLLLDKLKTLVQEVNSDELFSDSERHNFVSGLNQKVSQVKNEWSMLTLMNLEQAEAKRALLVLMEADAPQPPEFSGLVEARLLSQSQDAVAVPETPAPIKAPPNVPRTPNVLVSPVDLNEAVAHVMRNSPRRPSRQECREELVHLARSLEALGLYPPNRRT